MIQEAVDLRPKLATEHPGIFNSVFASSLDELSRQLANLGYSEQALDVLHEAAIIHGQCAAV